MGRCSEKGLSSSVATRPPLRRAVGRVVGSGLLGAATTPGRLLRVEAVLVVAALVLGVLGVLGGMARVSAVHDARTRIAALTTDAAELYQSLADADAMATTGYVSGGLEPAAVRARYDDDIAARRAGCSPAPRGCCRRATPRSRRSPRSASSCPSTPGWSRTPARYNRLGLPLGQSYLASASKLMQTHDPARRRGAAHGCRPPRSPSPTGRARRVPFAVLADRPRRRSPRWSISAAAGAAAHQPGAQRRPRRGRARGARRPAVVGGRARRRRRAHSAARAAQRRGRAALDDARAAVLQARSNESLVLVARNSGGGPPTTPSPPSWTTSVRRLRRCWPTPSAPTRSPPTAWPRCAAAAAAWSAAHRGVRRLDDGGHYRAGRRLGRRPRAGLGPAPRSTRSTRRLAAAIGEERAAFAVDVEAAEGALVALAVGSRRCWRWSRRAP